MTGVASVQSFATPVCRVCGVCHARGAVCYPGRRVWRVGCAAARPMVAVPWGIAVWCGSASKNGGRCLQRIVWE